MPSGYIIMFQDCLAVYLTCVTTFLCYIIIPMLSRIVLMLCEIKDKPGCVFTDDRGQQEAVCLSVCEH